MDNVVTTLVFTFLIGSSSFFHVTRAAMKALMSLKSSRIRPEIYKLDALEQLGKSPLTYNGRNFVTTPVPSLLIGSSSFLQATWTPINSRMGSKFGQIGPWNVELAALEL